jgi:hypothetical protein
MQTIEINQYGVVYLYEKPLEELRTIVNYLTDPKTKTEKPVIEVSFRLNKAIHDDIGIIVKLLNSHNCQISGLDLSETNISDQGLRITHPTL